MIIDLLAGAHLRQVFVLVTVVAALRAQFLFRHMNNSALVTWQVGGGPLHLADAEPGSDICCLTLPPLILSNQYILITKTSIF